MVKLCGSVKTDPYKCNNDYYVELNELGNIVDCELKKIPEYFKNVKINEYVIMPNHLHFIIQIDNNNEKNGVGVGLDRPTIPQIIGLYKSGVTRFYNQKIKANIQIWQRNYYEHIIRNENEYYRIIEYIKNNPQKWADDFC